MRRRLDIERQTRLEPKRMEAAYKAILNAGYKPEILGFKDQVSKAITFVYKGNTITYFAYSGWFTGKGITDGRGLKTLLDQITPIDDAVSPNIDSGNRPPLIT